MIPPGEALKIVLDRVTPLKAASVPLEEALGRCLAEPIRADRDLPPADRSAMDGYAVKAADLASIPATLKVTAEVAAGSDASPEILPGTCARIFTGANVPPDADTVVIVEDTREEGNEVSILSGTPAGANIFRQGEDAARGEELLSAGTVLGPMQIGVCSSVGMARPKVHAKPRIAVICTGAELRHAEDSVATHEIRNSNGPFLSSALRTWGFSDVDSGTAPDLNERLLPDIRKATEDHEVVILTGGVSKGKYDIVRGVLTELGAEIHIHGVRMKPGKPFLYATFPGERHIFGLPGNPLSTAVGFQEFVLPALRRLSGIPPEKCRRTFPLPLASDVKVKGGRMRFLPGRLLVADGALQVEAVESRSSADLAAGGLADGTFCVGSGERHLEKGTTVEFHPWRTLP